MRVAVNSDDLPAYNKNRIASILCIFEPHASCLGVMPSEHSNSVKIKRYTSVYSKRANWPYIRVTLTCCCFKPPESHMQWGREWGGVGRSYWFGLHACCVCAWVCACMHSNNNFWTTRPRALLSPTGSLFQILTYLIWHCGNMWHICLPNASQRHVIRPIGWFNLVYQAASSRVTETILY